jgi:hypothetical protein
MAVGGGEAVALKARLRWATAATPSAFCSSFQRQGRKTDYNLHAKYVIERRDACANGELSTAYFLDGSIASPFLQAMILIF